MNHQKFKTIRNSASCSWSRGYNPDTHSRSAMVKRLDIFNSNIYVGGTHNLQDIIGIHPSWFYITKLNDTLGIEYEKYIGSEDYYVLFNVTASQDCGDLLSGTKQDINMSYVEPNGFIIKLYSLGCLTSIQNDENFTITDAIIYPNPASDKVFVRISVKNSVFYLYDTQGIVLLKNALNKQSLVTEVNTSSIPYGNYAWVILNENNIIERGKLLIIK